MKAMPVRTWAKPGRSWFHRRCGEMVRRCHEGPPVARVGAVREAPEEGEVGPGFHAAPTV